MRKRRRSKFAPAREESIDAPGVDAGQLLADPAANPEQAASDRELQAALAHAIDALDPLRREVLVLRDVEGLSAPEVATVLGISVDAVKSRLHRARVAVRRQLAPLLGSPVTSGGPGIDTSSGSMCPDVLMLFSRHLEGDIDPEACAAMEAHLAQCRRCRGVCESLRHTLAVCRQLPTPEVPASIAAAVKADLRTALNLR